MLSAHPTCASSRSPSSQCCPSPAVPVTPSLRPVLPPHSQLVLSCMSTKLPRICSLRGVRRGQQVPLCLSQGSHHAEQPSEESWSCRLGPCPRSTVLMPRGDRCRAGNAPGIPTGRGQAPCLPSVLVPKHAAHTQGQPSLCLHHSRAQRTGNVNAGSGWSGERGSRGLDEQLPL